MRNTSDLSDHTGNIIAVTEFMGEPIKNVFRIQGLRSIIAVRSGPQRWRLLDNQEWPWIPGQDAASAEITGWKPASFIAGDAAPAESKVEQIDESTEYMLTEVEAIELAEWSKGVLAKAEKFRAWAERLAAPKHFYSRELYHWNAYAAYSQLRTDFCNRAPHAASKLTEHYREVQRRADAARKEHP